MLGCVVLHCGARNKANSNRIRTPPVGHRPTGGFVVDSGPQTPGRLQEVATAGIGGASLQPCVVADAGDTGYWLPW